MRACSPSPTMSMPASSCSLTARIVASSFACSSSRPDNFHGAQSLSGSASQFGLGRPPAIVVLSMLILPPQLQPYHGTAHPFQVQAVTPRLIRQAPEMGDGL